MVANKRITAHEKRLRASLLRKAEQSARIHNSNHDRQYNQKLNKFSLMTSEEKIQHLGLENTTLTDADEGRPPSSSQEVLLSTLTGNDADEGRPPSSSQEVLLSTRSLPDKYSHRDHGHVTSVKDQETCGSCWAFAATGAFEGSYSSVTGVLKSFSAKELLDCTYPSNYKACKGGWYHRAWQYIKREGRFASERDIPYIRRQESCSKWHDKPNGIRNAKYVNYFRTHKTNWHWQLRQTIRSYTPAIAFTVEKDFYGYEVGHYDGCPTLKSVNHAIILVGYGPHFWEGKNSWGADWGDKGFVKFTRTIHNVCRILDYVMYPLVEKEERGEEDEPDAPSERDMVEVAGGKVTDSSDDIPVPTTVDGDDGSCTATNRTRLPYFRVNLGKTYRVHRVEIVTDKPASLVDSTVHIGTQGDFMDTEFGMIKEVEDGKAVLRSEDAVEGSWVYLELYRKWELILSVCEIRVFAAPTEEDEDDGTCPKGITLCPDGVCRHIHMC